MSHHRYDVDTKAGEDTVIELVLTDELGQPLNLSTSTNISSHCRDRLSNFLFEFEVLTVDAVNGIIRLVIDRTLTLLLHGIYLFDVRVDFDQGNSYTETKTIRFRKAQTLTV